MKRYVFLLLFVCLSFVVSAKKTTSRVPKWVCTMTKGSTIVSTNRDFSSIISYNTPEFIGYIGKDYHKIREFGIRKGLKKLVISSKIRIFIGENQ